MELNDFNKNLLLREFKRMTESIEKYENEVLKMDKENLLDYRFINLQTAKTELNGFKIALICCGIDTDIFFRDIPGRDNK